MTISHEEDVYYLIRQKDNKLTLGKLESGRRLGLKGGGEIIAEFAVPKGQKLELLNEYYADEMIE